MEKTNLLERKTIAKQTSLEPPNKHVIWDCGSSLYDSFELKAFEKQLESAIVSRTLSMPHLSNRRLPPPPPPPPPSDKKGTSRVSRSFHRLMRAVFRPKNRTNSCITGTAISPGKFEQERTEEGFYLVYDKSAALSTIPEVPELDHGQMSPDLKSLVRRTASDRFSTAANKF